MIHSKRHRFPWTTNEINQLYSEYKNELPISTIAKRHERSEYAILYKLSDKFLISQSWHDVKGWNGHKNDDDDDDDDDIGCLNMYRTSFRP